MAKFIIYSFAQKSTFMTGGYLRDNLEISVDNWKKIQNKENKIYSYEVILPNPITRWNDIEYSIVVKKSFIPEIDDWSNINNDLIEKNKDDTKSTEEDDIELIMKDDNYEG